MSRFFSKQIYRKLRYVLPSSVRLFMMHYGNQCATLADDLYQLCACRKWLIVICSTFFILSWKPQQKITQTIFQIDDKLLVLTWVFNPQTRFSLENSHFIFIMFTFPSPLTITRRFLLTRVKCQESP